MAEENARVGVRMARRLGVALGGGGARGLAHLGVLQALADAEIPIHALAGISAGALMAAGHCLGSTAEPLIAALDRRAPILGMYRDRLRLAPSNAFGALLSDLVGSTRIEHCVPALAIAVADVERRECLSLREGPLLNVLRASIALPFVARPVLLGGRYYADCGRDNAVLRAALRAMGAEIVLEVSLFAARGGELPQPLRAGGRALLRRCDGPSMPRPRGRDLLRFAVDLLVRTRPLEPAADLLLAPRTPLIPVLAPEGLRRARRAGYEAMCTALPRLQFLLHDAPLSAAVGGGQPC